MKLGLVLEGGAMRGMYTAGVLDTFLEENIHADGVVGVSAGALFGINYLSRQAGRVIRYNKHYNADPDYMGIRPLLREGNIVSTRLAYDTVPKYADPFDDVTFQKSGIPFYAVVTDMESGKAEYVHIKSVFAQMDTLRASGSMPFVSRPVEIGTRQYLDGAVADSIPFRFMGCMGYDKLIVVLTRDMSYRKSAVNPILAKAYYRRYPHFLCALQARHILYNQAVKTLRRWEKDGRAFVIRPSVPISVKRTEKDPQKLQEVYDLGISDTRALLPALRAYIEKA